MEEGLQKGNPRQSPEGDHLWEEVHETGNACRNLTCRAGWG